MVNRGSPGTGLGPFKHLETGSIEISDIGREELTRSFISPYPGRLRKVS